MKKKRSAKLTLNRETILGLRGAPGVAGGTEEPTTFPQPMATDCACYTEAPGCGLPPTACFGSCSC